MTAFITAVRRWLRPSRPRHSAGRTRPTQTTGRTAPNPAHVDRIPRRRLGW